MQVILLLADVGLFVLGYMILQRQQEIMILASRREKTLSRVSKKKRAKRYVIVKKTHERELVRVVPTATEFMRSQYKRVAKQYNEKK
jgi:hypothetical protein